MRSREVERLVKQILAGWNLTDAFRVECPSGLRRIGEKGDTRHVGKVVILTTADGNWQNASISEEALRVLSTEITNAADDVNTVLYDITNGSVPTERIFTPAS